MCTCVYKSNQKCVSIGGLYFGPLLVAYLAQKWTHTLGQPFTYHAYLTGTEESKQIQRLHTLLGDFFPARCNHHLQLRDRTIFWRARPFFPVTHCPNNLISIRSLQQHTQTQTHIQGQRESIFVTKGPLPCPPCSYYCLCNHDCYYYYYLEWKFARRDLPGNDTKCIHVSGKGVALPEK